MSTEPPRRSRAAGQGEDADDVGAPFDFLESFQPVGGPQCSSYAQPDDRRTRDDVGRRPPLLDFRASAEHAEGVSSWSWTCPASEG
jgi:hypothetical protein